MKPGFPAILTLTAAATVAVALGLGALFAPDLASGPVSDPVSDPVATPIAEPVPPVEPAPEPPAAGGGDGPRPVLAPVDPAGLAAPDPVVAVAARPGRRNIAWNLMEVSYWSTQQPFLDVMKTAMPWVGHLPGQWGGRDAADLAAAGALDDDGWVRFVPNDLSHVSTLIFAELPAAMTSFGGRYVARWEGDARLGFTGAARNVRYDGNSARFDFVPGTGSVTIEFRRGSLRNLTIVPEVHLAAFDAGAIFHPGFLARIGDAENLRFMDWMRTNNSDLARWQDRPRPSDYSYERRGVPLEILLALANETGAEPWFTLPHQADDAFIRAFGEGVRDGLRPDLRAWVEYSNEVWNFSFRQAHWAEEQARARWDREWAWTQFYTVRAVQMVGILNQVFAAAPERLVRVIATQTGWMGLEGDLLEAPLWRSESAAHPAPWSLFDAYAVTAYFNAELHDASRQAMIRDWLADSRRAAEAEGRESGLTGPALAAYVTARRFDQAVHRAGEELIDGRHSGRPEGTVRHLLDTVLPYHAGIAAERGLALVMYEGGTHVVTEPGQHGDAELVAFFEALNHSEAMAGAYEVLLEGWAAITPAPFNAYVAIGAPNIWGAWGALRHHDDDSPRWRALIAASAR